MRPYVLTGTYPNGVRAWEQWNRRRLDGKLERIATIRYYRNGQKSYEYTSLLTKHTIGLPTEDAQVLKISGSILRPNGLFRSATWAADIPGLSSERALNRPPMHRRFFFPAGM
jgi:hypothetical protein